MAGDPASQISPPAKASVPPSQTSVQIRVGGVVVNVPAILLTAIVTAIVTIYTPASVLPVPSDSSRLAARLDAVEKQLKDIAADALRKQQVQCVDTLNKEIGFTRSAVRTLVSVLKRPPVNARIRMADDSEDEVEYHEPPLNKRSPQLQPKTVIPEAPKPL
jgi:hypothetical protein